MSYSCPKCGHPCLPPAVSPNSNRLCAGCGQRFSPSAAVDSRPVIDWDRIRDVSDVILPDDFPALDRYGDSSDDKAQRLDRISHGARVVDRAGNRFLLMGWGSVQGTVILRDRYRRMFHADGSLRLEVVS